MADLFLAEHRLSHMTEPEVRVLQAALSSACVRMTARGEPVRYLGSTFLPASGRLFSLFRAEGGDVVRKAADSSQAPVRSLEVAIDLPNHKED